LNEQGFKVLLADLRIFVKGHTYIAVYVDDLLIVRSLKDKIAALKSALSKYFEMTNLRPCTYYLGMQVTRNQ
jgi:hypothetical protein